MRFEIEINDKTIHEAAHLVETHFQDEAIYYLLCGVEKFNHTIDSGQLVGMRILNSDLKITIKSYKSVYPWSKSIGHAKGHTIYVNTRKLHLPLKDRVQNFFHEICHLLGYTHKGNYVNAYNLNTVPYRASALFVKYLEQIGKL